MRKQIIASSVLNGLKPLNKHYSVRDKALSGFAVKINSSGNGITTSYGYDPRQLLQSLQSINSSQINYVGKAADSRQIIPLSW